MPDLREPKPSIRPDIYIALVGAAGTDLEQIKNQIKAQLVSFDYNYQEVKVSALIKDFLAVPTDRMEEDERIKALMDGGDRIRKEYGAGDGVVPLIANAIRAIREKVGEKEEGISGSLGIVIDSLKNPAEVQSLDQIYGRNFYVISVFSDENSRKTRLANKIAESAGAPPSEEHLLRAAEIIRQDERRDASDVSQDVLNTFPKADFFVEVGDGIEKQIKRFIELVFGEPFTTPTLAEYGMFIAKAASLRSDDLSRQVGAAILDETGRIIATGCNEVPYPGGGFFYEGREGATDNRDHKVQYDPNSTEISNALAEIVRAFRDADLLKEAACDGDDNAVAQRFLRGDLKAHLLNARVRNLIEFGRVVHAEMHAISQAAQTGQAVDKSTLYCTTFPCHICARHIIASGIMRVVYIEPYPKSMTKELYEREITTSEHQASLANPVRFEPFLGVSPILFRRVFSFKPRKNASGTVVQFARAKAIPLGAVFGITNAKLEIRMSAKVDELAKLCEQNDAANDIVGQKHEQGAAPESGQERR